MKKFSFLIVFALMFTFTSLAFAQEEHFDFKKVRWGMSMDEVKKSESIKPFKIKKGDYIAYKVTVAEMPARLVYSFYKNKLEKAIYYFEISNPSQGLRKICSILEDKYKVAVVSAHSPLLENNNTIVMPSDATGELVVAYLSKEIIKERARDDAAKKEEEIKRQEQIKKEAIKDL